MKTVMFRKKNKTWATIFILSIIISLHSLTTYASRSLLANKAEDAKPDQISAIVNYFFRQATGSNTLLPSNIANLTHVFMPRYILRVLVTVDLYGTFAAFPLNGSPLNNNTEFPMLLNQPSGEAQRMELIPRVSSYILPNLNQKAIISYHILGFSYNQIDKNFFNISYENTVGSMLWLTGRKAVAAINPWVTQHLSLTQFDAWAQHHRQAGFFRLNANNLGSVHRGIYAPPITETANISYSSPETMTERYYATKVSAKDLQRIISTVFKMSFPLEISRLLVSYRQSQDYLYEGLMTANIVWHLQYLFKKMNAENYERWRNKWKYPVKALIQ